MTRVTFVSGGGNTYPGDGRCTAGVEDRAISCSEGLSCDNQNMISHEFRFECRRHADRGVLEVVPCIDAIPLTGAQPIGSAREGSSRV